MNIFRFIIPKSLVEYITVDSTVRQGLEKMRFHRYVAIPVLDADGKYVGMLRNDDILQYFLSVSSFDLKQAEKTSVSDIVDVSYSRPLYHHSTMEELFELVYDSMLHDKTMEFLILNNRFVEKTSDMTDKT